MSGGISREREGDSLVSYRFLLDLALILLSTKLLGIVTKKFQMPQVVGSLLAGLLLGPSMLNILQETEFLDQISELGVIVILFTAGVGTSIQDLKESGKAGFWVALLGVLTPLLMGAGLAMGAEHWGLISAGGWLEAVFVGTILTATSVSITVETLRELGKLNTRVGNTILAAALIDDVLGLVALTIVSGLGGSSSGMALVLGKIVAFFVFAAVVGWCATKAFCWMMARADGRNRRRFTVLAFVLCLLMAYCAEAFFGVADIIGAYVAGLAISCTPKATYIQSKFEPLSYLLVTPVFFASVGISADVRGIDGSVMLFTLLLVLLAVISKVVGCGLGAKLCGFTNKESLQVGLGMTCRGEVALIVANRGLEMGVISQTMMTPVIITVVACSILTPVLLKLAYRGEGAGQLEESGLTDRVVKPDQLDILSDELLQKDQELMKRP